MNVSEALKSIGCTLLLGDPEAEVREVVYDSRKAPPARCLCV